MNYGQELPVYQYQPQQVSAFHPDSFVDASPFTPIVQRVESDYSGVESQLIGAINNERAQHGLRPLAPMQQLQGFARNWANWMAGHHSMTHSHGPYGENIAMGQSSVQEAVSTWMNSKGHRANILNPNYQYTGASVAYNGGTPYWIQDFK
jgi:uncharacterized protein YkwD